MKLQFSPRALAASIALIGVMAAPAQATLLSGTLDGASSFNAYATPTGPSVTTWAHLGGSTTNWTGLSITNPASITGITPNLLSVAGITLTCGGFPCQNIQWANNGSSYGATASISFSSISSSTPSISGTAVTGGYELFKLAGTANTLTFYANSVTKGYSNNTYSAVFNGYMDVTSGADEPNYDPTPFKVTFSTAGGLGPYSFQAMANVPAPASVALLGLGMLGLAGLTRRSRPVAA